jgi:hypothetical protein
MVGSAMRTAVRPGRVEPCPGIGMVTGEWDDPILSGILIDSLARAKDAESKQTIFDPAPMVFLSVYETLSCENRCCNPAHLMLVTAKGPSGAKP